jgi:hypothetical protein
VFSKKSIVVVATAMMLALSLAAQAKKPEWKDGQKEYNLYLAVTKAGTPAAQLAALNKWKAAYPESDYNDIRLQAYLITYQQLNQGRQAFDAAAEILKEKPNEVRALSAILHYVQTFKPPQSSDLDTAQKTADYVLDHMDTIFAASNMPQGTTADAWAKTKAEMKPYALNALIWIAQQRPDKARAEADLTALLEKYPNEAGISYALAGTILAQAKAHPEKQPEALYQYARSAAYDGPGSLPAATRQQVHSYLAKIYPQYHGSADGMDKLLATAKANPRMPAGFKILSTADLARQAQESDEQYKASHPMLYLWVRTLKAALTKPDGQAYFDMNVKGALLPGGVNGVMEFTGKLISMKPEIRPKELVLAVEDPNTPDVTLELAEALPGTMDPGADISFKGVAKSFTASPFMITFDVDKATMGAVDGWTPKKPVRRTGGAARKGKSRRK